MIEGMRTFIRSCPFLGEFSQDAIQIDWTDPDSDYGVECTGDGRIGSYVGGTEKRAATYALYARGWTVEDANRLANNQFCERFTRWASQQQRARNLPILSEGRNAVKLEVSNGMLLFYDDSASTGTYQIQMKMTYTMEV